MVHWSLIFETHRKQHIQQTRSTTPDAATSRTSAPSGSFGSSIHGGTFFNVATKLPNPKPCFPSKLVLSLFLCICLWIWYEGFLRISLIETGLAIVFSSSSLFMSDKTICVYSLGNPVCILNLVTWWSRKQIKLVRGNEQEPAMSNHNLYTFSSSSFVSSNQARAVSSSICLLARTLSRGMSLAFCTVNSIVKQLISANVPLSSTSSGNSPLYLPDKINGWPSVMSGIWEGNSCKRQRQEEGQEKKSKNLMLLKMFFKVPRLSGGVLKHRKWHWLRLLW